MLKLIKELFKLLTPSQRKRFFSLQVLVIIMAFAEIIGIASIAPFMALVGDIDMLNRDNILADIYNLSGIATREDFVFWAGVTVLVALALAAAISMFTTWRLSMFSVTVGTEVADRLYAHYLQKDWLFHASNNSASLTKNVASETVRITNQIIRPLLDINAKIGIILFISVGLFIYDPVVALTGLLIFAFAYTLLFKIVRKRLQRNGKNISSVSGQRYQLMNEGFGGIKDILLLNRQQDFISRFQKSGKLFAYSLGNNQAIAQVPRYFMELIAFGTMVSLVLYLLTKHQGDLGLVLPVLSLYALAGFKLLPAFQNVYSKVTQIKGAISAFEAIEQDLKASKEIPLHTQNNTTPSEKFPLTKSIYLENITFAYPGKSQHALQNLTINIPANSVVGIVGPSGSGKSTAIDMLLGLIQPQQGQLKIDDSVITDQNRRAWQNTIGFVPQSIFLSEGTIAENVAFGIAEKDINLEQVKKALSLAHLEELVQSLDKGIHTKVGERGVQLSGGQRQRIGIARALYHEVDVLVFDEATSSLDGITEKMIMEAIHDFSGQKTIILVAHRLKTVQKCNQIYFIDKGQVRDQGTYLELIDKNQDFKRMADHA